MAVSLEKSFCSFFYKSKEPNRDFLYKFGENFNLKNYFIRYKPFLVFLGTFFLVYILLTLAYQGFLSSFPDDKMDSITGMVGNHVDFVLQLVNPDSKVVPDFNKPQASIFYNGKITALLVEGCNVVSVLILFVSFVAAFSGKWKTTLLFIMGGSFLVYVLNIIRIALLTILLYHFPDYRVVVHDIIFPLFIYGVVFLLWIFWVNKFSKYAKKTTTL